MIIKDWLVYANARLKKAGVATSRLDALVLLEDLTGKDRSWLLGHEEFELSSTQTRRLNIQIRQRANHEPLAYIRGKTEFYGREFIIDSRVLEPRPESETMIELLKSLKLSDNPHIVDIGTGSGALGITAAVELPGSTVDLTDIDPGCLEVARENLKIHKVTAELYEADLISAEIRYQPDVILANLPYVPDRYTLNEAAMNEPKTAIFGGPDGMDLYRKLFKQLVGLAKKPEFILTESLPFQHDRLAEIARLTGYQLSSADDFIQLFEPSR